MDGISQAKRLRPTYSPVRLGMLSVNPARAAGFLRAREDLANQISFCLFCFLTIDRPVAPQKVMSCTSHTQECAMPEMGYSDFLVSTSLIASAVVSI